MTYNVFSGTLNPTQSINQSISSSRHTHGRHDGSCVAGTIRAQIWPEKTSSWNAFSIDGPSRPAMCRRNRLDGPLKTSTVMQLIYLSIKVTSTIRSKLSKLGLSI